MLKDEEDLQENKENKKETTPFLCTQTSELLSTTNFERGSVSTSFSFSLSIS
jgi:hypothetical protein